MEIKDQVRSVGNEDTAIVVDSFFGQAVEFCQKGREMNDDTISNDTDRVGVQDTTGKQMKFVLDTINYDGVSRIRSASDTCTDIILLLLLLFIDDYE